MTDNRTTELCISEPLRGFIRHQSNRAYIDGGQASWLTKIADGIDAKHEQAIAVTLGSQIDADLRKAIDFMRIWIAEDAHLGESAISRELEKAEGLRKLDAIEQAIAATLGGQPASLTAEQVHDAVLENFKETHETRYDHWEPSKFDWQAIADELNATLGRGTCEIETTENWLPAERYHRCKHCGAFFAVMDASGDIPPCVCPNCGKVVER